jgi:hypothetical protein
MAENEKYTSTWRGTKRYRFDEEARRKRLAVDPSANPSLVPVMVGVAVFAVILAIYGAFFR